MAPEAFAPGACVALAPLHGNVGRTVFIDAGHGGPDPGALGTTASGQPLNEKSVTLAVALAAARMLRLHGYRVVLSRTADNSVTRLTGADLYQRALSIRGAHAELLARVRCAELSGASVLVSVHFDAFSDSTATGATTVYDPDRPFAGRNRALAKLLQHDIVGALGADGWQVEDRGVSTDVNAGGPALGVQGTSYGHLLILGPAAPGYLARPTTMPGAVVEPLFITNPAEASIAASTAGQTAIAAGIVAATTQFIRGSR